MDPVIIDILIFVKALMQGIYSYVWKNHVSSVHNILATLLLQFMIYVILFAMINVWYP
jgi:hypothetical protein